MFEEKNIPTKVCSCCGNKLPVTAFNKHNHAKDGYEAICRNCKVKNRGSNPDLAKFQPRELIEELRARGYHGTLEYVQRHEIKL